MEKVSEQSLPGLYNLQWWNIGQGYTALVKTQDTISTIQILTKTSVPDAPPHWNQYSEVTEKIVSGMVISWDNVQLITDEIQCQYLQCNSADVNELLQLLESYVAK